MGNTTRKEFLICDKKLKMSLERRVGDDLLFRVIGIVEDDVMYHFDTYDNSYIPVIQFSKSISHPNVWKLVHSAIEKVPSRNPDMGVQYYERLDKFLKANKVEFFPDRSDYNILNSEIPKH